MAHFRSARALLPGKPRRLPHSRVSLLFSAIPRTRFPDRATGPSGFSPLTGVRSRHPLMPIQHGSRTEVHKAVMRLAHAEGRLATMQRLDDLADAARAWRDRLDVEPKKADMIETCRDREWTRQAA